MSSFLGMTKTTHCVDSKHEKHHQFHVYRGKKMLELIIFLLDPKKLILLIDI